MPAGYVYCCWLSFRMCFEFRMFVPVKKGPRYDTDFRDEDSRKMLTDYRFIFCLYRLMSALTTLILWWRRGFRMLDVRACGEAVSLTLYICAAPMSTLNFMNALDFRRVTCGCNDNGVADWCLCCLYAAGFLSHSLGTGDRRFTEDCIYAAFDVALIDVHVWYVSKQKT